MLTSLNPFDIPIGVALQVRSEHQETWLALSRLCSARRSDELIEIPLAYAEPPVSVQSMLSLSGSIRSMLSLSGSVGSRCAGSYPPRPSYQLVF